MKKRSLAAWLALVAVAAIATSAATASHQPGFKTVRPPQLVPAAPGVIVDPILSVGDIVANSPIPGGYQMSGIPDGLGAFKDGHNTISIMMNHELDPLFPAQPFTPPGVGTRISKVTIDRKTRSVLKASYPFTGLEGFARFCSASLHTVRGTPYFFTGEETSTDSTLTPNPLDSGRGGSSIVMNAETGTWVETRHFGLLQHENVVLLERLNEWMVLTSDDDFRPGQPAYLYAYIADTWEALISGDPTKGSLYVWRALDATVTQADMEKGEVIPGRFVPISQAENTHEAVLKAAATARDAFKFSRLEDIALSQTEPGLTYIADTGKAPNGLRGRVYTFDVHPEDPTRADLMVLLDGDRGDDIYNPDNMDASAQSLMIQEDRESIFRDPPFSGGYGRIMRYDLQHHTLTPVARVNTPPPLRPGTWESSGIIWAGNLLGDHWWITDVQAHNTLAPQPGVTLTPNTAQGEDGQLQAMYVPNS